MAVLKNIPIDISAQEIMTALSCGRRDASWMADRIRSALDRTAGLIVPVAVYDWFSVEAVSGGRVRLGRADGTGVDLTVGPNAGLMTGAEMAIVSVNSIGGALEEAVREENRKEEPLSAYLLDCVGVIALGKVADAVARMAEAEAASRGWGVGPRLGPGSLDGWPTERQGEICRLLPLEPAGIRLTGSGLILPLKSASGMIGIGPGFDSRRVGSVCGLCSLKDTCWRRKPAPEE